MANLGKIPTLDFAELQKAQYTAQYHYHFMADQLLHVGFNIYHAEKVAQEVCNMWYELMHQQPVDDVFGIPINNEMLPFGYASQELLRLWLPDYHDNDYKVMDYGWSALKYTLINDVFRGLDHGDGVELAISLGPSIWLLPDNDIGELGAASLRMFSTEMAAQQYSDDGWAKHCAKDD